MAKNPVDVIIENTKAVTARGFEDALLAVRARFGVTYAQIAAAIGTTERAVYHWLAARSSPRCRELAILFALDAGSLGIIVTDLGVPCLVALEPTPEPEPTAKVTITRGRSPRRARRTQRRST